MNAKIWVIEEDTYNDGTWVVREFYFSRKQARQERDYLQSCFTDAKFRIMKYVRQDEK